jgi:antagonist of KipI
MEDVIEVMIPGIHVTVQDMGRFGYRSYGVPTSGALDRYSLAAANWLVGNEIGEACLEIMGGYFRFKALKDMIMAVTGAQVVLKIGQERKEIWKPIFVREGSLVELSIPLKGFINYVAIHGGFDAERVMKSKSTYTRANFGGFHGRKLKKGDVLRTASPSKIKEVWDMVRDRSIPINERPVLSGVKDLVKVRVTKGTHEYMFTDEEFERFCNNVYTVTSDSDRMGYRLEGEPLLSEERTGRVPSFPIIEGFVQIPTNGLPIVLLADAQTTGGYPVIAAVIQPDVYKVANTRPGGRIKFEMMEVKEAEKETKDWLEKMAMFEVHDEILT